MYKNMFFQFFLFPIGHLTHPPTSKVFLDFWNFVIYMAHNVTQLWYVANVVSVLFKIQLP